MQKGPLTPEVLVPRLGDYLIDKGLITTRDLEQALSYQDSQSASEATPLLGQILVSLGLIDEATLDQAITEQILLLRNALIEANQNLEKRVQERTSELIAAYQKLAELDALKSNFISNISHELRTPLTHLCGYIDLLSSGALGPLQGEEQQQAVKTMKKAQQRLTKLIDDLILFSTVEREELSFNFCETNIKSIFDKLATEVVSLIDGKNLSIAFICPDTLKNVYIDKDMILIVLRQLIDNAVKFSKMGGNITVKAEWTGSDSLISVADDGIGIPEEKLIEIFEPFHQIDSSPTRRYGGTGLGLSLAQMILKAHNSEIMATSLVGNGSTFQFILHNNLSISK